MYVCVRVCVYLHTDTFSPSFTHPHTLTHLFLYDSHTLTRAVSLSQSLENTHTVYFTLTLSLTLSLKQPFIRILTRRVCARDGCVGRGVLAGAGGRGCAPGAARGRGEGVRTPHTRAGASFGVRWVERGRLVVESVRRDACTRRRRSGECRLVCARVSLPGRREVGAGRGRLLRPWHAD